MEDNQIICGNSIEVLADLPGQSIDLVVTDPPYLCNYKDRYGRRVKNDNNASGVLPVFAELYRVLKSNRYCITFCGWSAIAGFATAWEEAGFKTVGRIVWPKPYASSQGHTAYFHEMAFVLAKGFPRKPMNPIDDVQPWEYSGNRAHPTQKAVSVITLLIRAFSAPNDLVLDPFLGSGTTAVSAALNDRRYIGIELEENYCALARRRLTGIKTPGKNFVHVA